MEMQNFIFFGEKVSQNILLCDTQKKVPYERIPHLFRLR